MKKTLRDVMTRDPVSVFPSTSVREIAELMKRNDVGVIPVMDGDRIHGLITDRDLVLRTLAESKNPDNTRAYEVMSTDVYYCSEDDTVDAAAKKMRAKQIRRLIVVDYNKRPVGIVSIGDLATEMKNKKLVGKTLEGISEGSSSKVVGLLETVGFSVVLGGVAMAGYYLWNNRDSFRSTDSNQAERAA